MFSAALLFLLSATAQRPVLVSIPGPAASPTIESTELLGFSADGDLVVTLLRVAEPRPGPAWDAYDLIRVSEVDGGEVLGTYQGSAIERFDDHGKPVRLAAGMLANMNPRYRRAQGKAAWERLARKVRLSQHVLSLTYGGVRLRRDPGTLMAAENIGDAFLVQGGPSSPIGYRVMVRTADNQTHELTRFHQTVAPGGVIQAEVRAFLSDDGRSIAVTNIFAFNDGDRIRAVSQVATARYDLKVATTRAPAPVSGPDIIAAAYDTYAGDAGVKIPEEMKNPLLMGRGQRLGPSQAVALYQTYKDMLGGNLKGSQHPALMVRF
jgi:hypothetical protein